MTDQRRRLGRRGEELAKRHLVSIGYAVLESNHRTKSGEIDLIAEREGVLVFVEVRTRRGSGFGSPEESVTAAKRSRLVTCAEEYIQSAGVESVDWRIDVVALELDASGRLIRLDVLENAVEV